MKNTLLVVADLGGFKAFRLHNEQERLLNNAALKRPPRLEFVEEFHNPEAHGRIVDRVSDLSGRFPRGTGRKSGGAMSDGERHNIELESRKRLVRQLAQRVNALARAQEIERCFLAASKEINSQLVQELEPQVRAKVEKNVPADLMKVERANIMRYF
ncbi:MAG TPA: host attachment protein [Verrucomicrobiae bacterium]|nr:host attachment protein [Verrucomicrobiae bacterium]